MTEHCLCSQITKTTCFWKKKKKKTHLAVRYKLFSIFFPHFSSFLNYQFEQVSLRSNLYITNAITRGVVFLFFKIIPYLITTTIRRYQYMLFDLIISKASPCASALLSSTSPIKLEQIDTCKCINTLAYCSQKTSCSPQPYTTLVRSIVWKQRVGRSAGDPVTWSRAMKQLALWRADTTGICAPSEHSGAVLFTERRDTYSIKEMIRATVELTAMTYHLLILLLHLITRRVLLLYCLFI